MRVHMHLNTHMYPPGAYASTTFPQNMYDTYTCYPEACVPLIGTKGSSLQGFGIHFFCYLIPASTISKAPYNVFHSCFVLHVPLLLWPRPLSLNVLELWSLYVLVLSDPECL